MLKIRALLFLAGVLFLGGGLVGQDAKKDKETKESKTLAKAKSSQLPQNWLKLGLTDEQKTKVYAIDAKFDKEIDDLTAKIKELKDDKRKEQLKVLTDEQKKRLEDIIKKAAGTDK